LPDGTHIAPAVIGISVAFPFPHLVVSEIIHGLFVTRQTRAHRRTKSMTDMAELKKRKVPLNLAIVYVDPDAYIASIMGWLEMPAFIRQWARRRCRLTA
jgi:hypothetical protein